MTDKDQTARTDLAKGYGPSADKLPRLADAGPAGASQAAAPSTPRGEE